MDEITCDIIRKIAVLNAYNDRTKECRLISWNKADPKFDIRDWGPDGRCGKGITLSIGEGYKLYNALDDFFKRRDIKEDVDKAKPVNLDIYPDEEEKEKTAEEEPSETSVSEDLDDLGDLPY